MNASRVQELASQMHGVRADFEHLLGELQERRRSATDLKLQARRHPQAAGVLGALLVGAVALYVRSRLRRRRELRDPLARRRRLRTAFARMAEDPDRVRVDGHGVLRHMATAAGSAFLTSFARRIAREASLPRRQARIVTPEASR
ncbi:MAG: hypothetical protein ACE147_06340 [Candidatus Methylomirabilales bacterium]